MIEKIISRIKPKYITTDNYNLSEPKEKMKVRLYKNDENIAIIRLDDDERDGLWKYFLDTDIAEHDIADYILFKETCSEIICFIVELKKRKTKHNTNKANKQILSTLPIAKMIYEKSTNLNAKSLKVVGLKIFGTGIQNKGNQLVGIFPFEKKNQKKMN